MSGINLKNPSGGSVSLVPEDGVGNVTATVRHDDGVLASEALVEAAEAHADFVAGVGRTWQDVTDSRTAGVTYTNNTGRDITVFIRFIGGDTRISSNLLVNDMLVSSYTVPTDSLSVAVSAYAQVPAGGSYITNLSNNSTIAAWRELR